MRTRTIARLEVLMDYNMIEASSDLDDRMEELHIDVDSIVMQAGFRRTHALDSNPSRRNGSCAYYDSYILLRDENEISLAIDVRSANHPSKPDLFVKNTRQESRFTRDTLPELLEEYPESDEVGFEPVDTYYQGRYWGAQYYLGKGNKYSEPINSLDKFNVMLKGYLEKLKSKYMK